MAAPHALAPHQASGAPGVSIVDTPEALTAFLSPGCAAAIWRRRPLPGFQAWIDALSPDLLPSGRVILAPEAVGETVAHLCDMVDMPRGPHRELLEGDIAALARIFTDLMRAPFLRLRLDVVDTNACRKFHIDAVTARLICTYRGQGTQYGVSEEGRDPRRVFTVPTGAPILLRGTLWRDVGRAPLLHRSPPIEGTGETRMLMVFDPILDPDTEV